MNVCMFAGNVRMGGRKTLAQTAVTTPVRLRMPSSISIKPTANSMVNPTRGGDGEIKKNDSGADDENGERYGRVPRVRQSSAAFR